MHHLERAVGGGTLFIKRGGGGGGDGRPVGPATNTPVSQSASGAAAAV